MVKALLVKFWGGCSTHMTKEGAAVLGCAEYSCPVKQDGGAPEGPALIRL
jgi:hypothetical protein